MAKDPAGKKNTGAGAFESDEAYLEALFALLDLLIFQEPGIRMEQYGLPADLKAGTWASEIRSRLEAGKEAGFSPALEEVLSKAGVPAYMRLTMAYLLRIALDPAYEKEAAAERWRESLTIAELIRITVPPEGDGTREELTDGELFDLVSAASPGLKLLFPQLAGKDMTGSAVPVMDRRLAALCMGKAGETGLPCGMYYMEPWRETAGRSRRDRDTDPESKLSGIREELAGLLMEREAAMPPEIVVLWGPEGSGKRSVLQVFAGSTGRRAVVLPLGKQLPDHSDPEYPVYPDTALLIRECVLTGSIPVIDGVGSLQREQAVRLSESLLSGALSMFRAVYLLVGAQEVPDYLTDVFYLEMPSIRTTDRIRLWQAAIGADALPEEAFEALANTFALTPGQIKRCAAQALRLAGPKKLVTEEILYHVCYALLGHPLKQHSQRVKSSFTWDDLKMAPADKVVLRDLCRSVRNRHIVMQEWGFEEKVPYGAGITALFSGPPGTGKTMAAQVIANELHMELYKIDVSQLIDKYVGETEKNIRRVFEQAKKSNSVLFFDEADAIFNKRLEAKNSNERFANIESSLLLQCIEEYDGVALLATNNMAAIDAAFIRRFRFYLTFKEPDEKIRREIWESVFPKRTPLAEEVDLGELAHIFSFNGAIIKNVALQSAYLAAQKKKPIGLLEILVAVRREMEKNQRVLAQEKMGRLGYLLPEVLKWSENS